MAKKKTDGMIVTLDSGDLHKALGRVQAAVERRVKIPILEHILMEADPETGLRLFGTNLDMQAESGFGPDAANVAQAGEACIDAAMLYQIVQRMKGAVTLAHDSAKHRLQLVCGRAKAELPTLPAGDFQKLGSMAHAVSFEIASGALKAGLGTVQHCVSTEETRHYLNGVYVEAKEGDLVFTATDGHRLAHLPVTSSGEALPDFAGVIIPRKAVQAILKLADAFDGPMVMAVSDRMVQVACGLDAFRSKLVDGDYPDYGRVIPKNPPISLPVPVAEFKEALNIVVAASTERSTAVKLAPSEGKLSLHVRSEQRGAEAIIEHDDLPEASAFGMNGKYLLQALDRIDAETVMIGMTDPHSPFRFEVPGERLIQVIMTLRI